MRAAKPKERPSFSLMKQTDIQNIYYMQMPQWLFSDSRYADMTLDAKVAYLNSLRAAPPRAGVPRLRPRPEERPLRRVSAPRPNRLAGLRRGVRKGGKHYAFVQTAAICAGRAPAPGLRA